MVKRQQVERIELPVEQTSYGARPEDRRRAARRVWTGMQHAAQVGADERARTVGSSMSGATATWAGGTTFRRVVDVPGARLETVLQAWWSRSSHDDGHLRFDRLTQNHGLIELDGSLRTSAVSRRIPVEVRLSPYHDRWTFLELTPQRSTHPRRVYFRVGHASLDRFVAALLRSNAK